jgi:hypothetical protein
MGCTSTKNTSTQSGYLKISGTTPRLRLPLLGPGGQPPIEVRVLIAQMSGWSTTAILVKGARGTSVVDLPTPVSIAAPTNPVTDGGATITDLGGLDELVIEPETPEAGFVRVWITAVYPDPHPAGAAP